LEHCNNSPLEKEVLECGAEVLHKEKRVWEWLAGKERRVRAYIDYIARKE
jgi:hypothetical protein